MNRKTHRQTCLETDPLDDACDVDPTLRIVIAGGGTGGHLFPGIAIAEALVRQYPDTRVLFVTSGRRIEETVLANTRFEKTRISVEGLKGKGLLAKFVSVCRLPKGMIEAFRLLLEFKPHLVIGMGAYSAGPVIMAAWMMGVHRVIHEQNSIPGLTNRLLSIISEKIYVSFPDTEFKASLQHKIDCTGNPVRSEILACALKHDGRKARISDGSHLPFNILVLGGSQGAHSINMAVIDSLIYLQDASRYRFIHQTGMMDADEVRKVYRRLKVQAVVSAFFDDMPKWYRAADLVICRSGATTVAELTVVGRAAIFIPFPFAADDHQRVNARTLVASGAAEMILEKDLSGKHLAAKIEFYAGNAPIIKEMETASQKFGQADAANRIADDIFRIIRG